MIGDEIVEIKNFVPRDYQKYILDYVTGLKFPWYYNMNMVSDHDPLLSDMGNIAGLNHFLYEDGEAVSPFFNTVYPLVLLIGDKAPEIKFQKLERMRFNLTFKNSVYPHEYHMPHIDNAMPHYVAIYYVNDSDGDTFIFNETNDTYTPKAYATMKSRDFTIKQRITPEQGKLVIFPGKYYHASSFAKNTKHRILINMNLTTMF